MNILIKFYNDTNELINSYSSLSIKVGAKQFFFNNTNSWQKITTNESFMKLEYLCLLEKNTIDIVEIIADDWQYKIQLSKNILIQNLNTYSFQCYINLNDCSFKKDIIDYDAYNNQIFCDKMLDVNHIPSISISIYDIVYEFKTWYNYDNSLLFISKDIINNTNATIQIFPKQSIFYVVLNNEYLKKDIILYSISHHFVPTNEIGQMDCTAIRYGFYSLKLLEPIIIAPQSYYNINNISSNIKIFQNI